MGSPPVTCSVMSRNVTQNRIVSLVRVSFHKKRYLNGVEHSQRNNTTMSILGNTNVCKCVLSIYMFRLHKCELGI